MPSTFLLCAFRQLLQIAGKNNVFIRLTLTCKVENNCQYRKQLENQWYLHTPMGTRTPNAFQTSCTIARVNAQSVLAALCPPLWPLAGVWLWPVLTKMCMVLGTNKHIPLLHLGHTKQPNRANIRSPSEMASWPKWQRDKWLFISLVDLSSDTSLLCLEILHNLRILTFSKSNLT